jgi:UDP-GlcNAc:undecaprenyl-phosphate GlcNAc-1-phosphate transferase
MVFLTTLLFSVFITIALIPIFTRVAVRVQLIDVPNERKVHPMPVPKSGGIAMAIGALIPILFWTHTESFVRWYLIGASIILILGLIDDFRGLRPEIKFSAQILAALIVILPGMVRIENLGMILPDGLLLPDWFSIPLTLITIVGVTNAINLSDGLDGLAGGITLLCFCCIGYLAYLVQDDVIVLLSVALAGAIFGFLRFNTYPASIFMGDTGSQFLGFSAIVFSLKLTQGETALSPLLPLIILGFPVLDTVVIMAQRLQEGRPLFSADKNHFHHRLMRLGYYQTESVLIIYVLQAALVTSALIFRFHSEWQLLVGYLTFSVIVTGAFTLANKKEYRIKRFKLFDQIIKGKLRELREKGIIIKVSFRITEFGIPCLLLFTCFLTADAPIYASYFAFALIGLIITIWRFWRKHLGLVLRSGLYIFIPYIIYTGNMETVSWMTGKLMRYYNLSFFVFAIFIILTVKFSRRKQGFKSTPMDFLILFIALGVPNLPVEEIRTYQLGLMAAKIITLFFSYEVLMGELREKFGKLTLFTILSLVTVAVKGIL